MKLHPCITEWTEGKRVDINKGQKYSVAIRMGAYG